MFAATIDSPFLQAGHNTEGTECHPLLLLDLLLVSGGVYLDYWWIWNFLGCSGCIHFQSKLSQTPFYLKCEYMLSLMES